MPTFIVQATSPPTPRLSRPSNRKLGPRIYSFSLPAEETCPGASAFCLRHCYARKGHFVHGALRRLYAANLDATLADGFARRMIRAVAREGPRVVRVHVSGDFYDAHYVRDWARVARGCPDTRFFAYTRSWREAAILPALAELAALPNVRLWFSEDRDTGPAPEMPGIPRCLLVHDADDEPLADPARHALVFRDRPHRSLANGVVKRVGGVLVCPAEAWYAWGPKMTTAREPPEFTCSACRICLRAEAPPAARIVPIGPPPGSSP